MLLDLSFITPGWVGTWVTAILFFVAVGTHTLVANTHGAGRVPRHAAIITVGTVVGGLLLNVLMTIHETSHSRIRWKEQREHWFCYIVMVGYCPSANSIWMLKE